MPQAKTSTRFLSPSRIQKEITNFPQAEFFDNRTFLFKQGVDGGNYERADKTTKIKLVKVLVPTFDKSYHLCTLRIFGYCFTVQ